MAQIILPDRWRRQPLRRTTIAAGFRHGLVEAQNFGEVISAPEGYQRVRDLVRDKEIVSAGAFGGFLARREGLAGAGSTGSSYFYEPAPFAPAANSDNAISILLTFAPFWDDRVSAQGIWQIADSVNDGGPMLLIASDATPTNYTARIYQGSGYRNSDIPLRPKLVNTLVATLYAQPPDNYVSINSYINGRMWYAGSGDVARWGGSNTYRWICTGYSQQSKQETFLHAVWNKRLPNEMAESLSRNPWQMFKRDVPRTYFFPPTRPEKKPAVTAPIRRNIVLPLTAKVIAPLRSAATSVWPAWISKSTIGPMYTAVNGGKWVMSKTKTVSHRDEFTLAIYFQALEAPTGGGRALICERPASGTDICKIIYGEDAVRGYSLVLRRDDGLLVRVRLDTTNDCDGKIHTLVGLRKSPTSHELWLDGFKVASNYVESFPGSMFTENMETLACADPQSLAQTSGVAIAAAIPNMAWREKDIKSFAVDPWQLFRPAVPRVYFYPRPMQPRRVWTLAPSRRREFP